MMKNEYKVVAHKIDPSLCSWCNVEKVKKGFAVCERCYQDHLKDKTRKVKVAWRFLCPICNGDLGHSFICPKCGVYATELMSLPSHCHICHCKWSYKKDGVTRCWCCKAIWKESGIDSYINYALQHFKQYEEWSKKNFSVVKEG